MRTFVPDRTCWSLLLTALAIRLRKAVQFCSNFSDITCQILSHHCILQRPRLRLRLRLSLRQRRRQRPRPRQRPRQRPHRRLHRHPNPYVAVVPLVPVLAVM